MRSLGEIKKLRKKFGVSQKELAAAAGVSQSLIAKIESGSVEPTFSKAQHIFKALDELSEKREPKARDVMNKKVFFVQINDKVKDVVQVMKKKGISQVPVMKGERICGIISEGSILNALVENPHQLDTLVVEKAMKEAPPIVSEETGVQTLFGLLQHFSTVLVATKGHIKGIVSKADMLGHLD